VSVGTSSGSRGIVSGVATHDLFSISCPGPHEKGVWCTKCKGDGIAAGGSDFKPVKAPKKSAWQK
jgi:hypothetical protein